MKLGPHIIRATGPALEWARRANIVKTIDDPMPLTIAPAHAIRVFRRYFPDQDGIAAQGGEAIARAIIDSLRGYNHPKLYVELLNEWRQFRDNIEFHADVVEAATGVLHAAGYKVAGFSFSTGNPEPDVWHYLQSRGFCGVDALSIHEYWAFAGFTTWNALRYRRVHEWLRGQHPPIIITECGRDAVGGEGGEGKPGWKVQGVPPEQYVGELLAYAAELARDHYVLGATVFTNGPYEDFAAFDVDELVPRILALAPTVSGGEPSMGYIERFPAEYDAWVQAGGPEHHFKAHILATNPNLPVTRADVEEILGNIAASVEQLRRILPRVPLR